MAVWGLANPDVYRKISNLWNTSRGGAQSIIVEVCMAISKHLKPIYIRLPTATECREMSAAFENKHRFPGICGCMDGTHISVKAPAWDRNGYINRHGKPSINVLAVCDHNMRYIYVYANTAGSVHDARVLRVSSLGNMLETSVWPPHDDFHLLGDSAYPLLPNLLPPYRDNGYLTTVQWRFNSVHSSARSIVENSFARLKGKFRRLKDIDATNIGNALQMIEASFTLHNYIIDHGGDGEFGGDEEEHDDDDGGSDVAPFSGHMGNTAMKQAAKEKRDRIASSL